MCKILENYQPKSNNLIEQKTIINPLNKNSISTQILENNSEDSSDSDDSDDSDDNLPKKKVITINKKKSIVDSDESESESDNSD